MAANPAEPATCGRFRRDVIFVEFEIDAARQQLNYCDGRSGRVLCGERPRPGHFDDLPHIRGTSAGWMPRHRTHKYASETVPSLAGARPCADGSVAGAGCICRVPAQTPATVAYVSPLSSESRLQNVFWRVWRARTAHPLLAITSSNCRICIPRGSKMSMSLPSTSAA